MPLTTSQIHAIDTTEKVGSVLSVLGASFVIVTFLSSSKFRKPINRLVFYASWGNILSNVATLIGTTAITLGPAAPLCQFQAFMIQWFMPADVLWTFAMACNVYLSFFHHFDAAQLRALEWKYMVFCYGLPLLPAVTYFFIDTSGRGRVYGNAVLWCWVAIDWDFLRVAVFYGPAWIIIILIIAIYLRVGQLIWHWRSQLNSLGRQSEQELQRTSERSTPIKGIRRTDEVTITTEVVTLPEPSHRIPSFRPDLGLYKKPAFHEIHLSSSRRSRKSSKDNTYRDANTHANRGMVRYCKCAMLFFLALLCTWVPSSMNRIYTLIHPDEVPFGTEYAAGLVLPLQGFWNCVVYVSTSLFACRCLWSDIRASISKNVPATTIKSTPSQQDGHSLVLRYSRVDPAESETASLKG